MGVFKHLAVCLFVAQTLAAPPPQAVLREQCNFDDHGGESQHAARKKPLHGRFLHITDFHPDRFYKVYTSTSEEAACHRGQGPAGIYGAESSDCDSPIGLINETMKWVGKEFKDKVDFVVWTGDSARHDNDEKVPRSEDQVIGLNEFMVHKMSEVFGKNNGDEDDDDPNNDYIIPIIPTIGNNDVLPHNIFRQGPNKWTRNYARIWRQFIPEEQRHQFEQGGWFYVEVIRNKLAVVSLNTMYFFKSNAAVDGCALPSEPGFGHFEWLRIQLQFMRERGMKAILIGHVPPVREDTKWSWDETCWQKYTLWLQQYRDVVVGSLYGHFNYDHMMLQDFDDLRKGTRKGKMPDYDEPKMLEDDVHSAVSSNYFVDLRERWSAIPDPPESLVWPKAAEADTEKNFLSKVLDGIVSVFKSKKKKRAEKEFLEQIGGEYAERFAASFVSASVVPNLFPTFRVYEYNISGMDAKREVDSIVSVPYETNGEEISVQKKKHKFTIPHPPSKSSPPGPAYSPQPLTWIRYTQYLANLTHINNDFQALSTAPHDPIEAGKWKEGKHKGKQPHDKGHTPDPRKFRFQVHYDTKDDDVYQLEDLTVPRLVDLARKIGNFIPEDDIIDIDGRKKDKRRKEQRKVNQAWWTFVRRAYVETLSADELEEEFG